MTKTVTKTDSDTPPKWDLADLFKGLDDPEIDKVLSYADGDSASFQKEFAGKLTSLSGAALVVRLHVMKIFLKAHSKS